jgi:hypothetical protein
MKIEKNFYFSFLKNSIMPKLILFLFSELFLHQHCHLTPFRMEFLFIINLFRYLLIMGKNDEIFTHFFVDSKMQHARIKKFN